MQDTMSETAPQNNEAIGEAITLDEQSTSASSGERKLDYSYTQNRELSWLQFDKRVLEEALDTSVPLLERMKFISIFCTNLDEFFMVRVGSLMDLSIIAPDIHENKTNMTPREQLEAVFAAVKPLVKERDEIYTLVASELENYGLKELDLEELSKKDRKFARDHYREFIRPVLSPQVVDERHPFPHLRNKELYIVTLLTDKDKSQHLGIIPVPDNIAPIISDPENPLHFVRAEKLIAFHVKKIFDIYETSEPCIISVTRNADISFDEEKFSDDEGDYRLHVSRLLKKRNRLQPVRLEIEGKPEKQLLTGLLKRLKLSKNQVYFYDAPINLGWVFGLERRFDADQKRKLCYAPFVPRASSEFDINRSILKQIEERDRLLFYPYDSIDPFLRMLQEAATDPDVLSIKITVYRLASESRVAQHLIEAAENGKEVTVLMELRARFDEANNIDWSGRLEEAGCNIIYGMENYKCHSKVCLITKRSDEGVRYITQIGTGNYNEKTARLYTDLSLFTSDAGIGRDAVSFFQNMLIGNLNGNYEKLLVAPVAIKRTILRLIDREIAKGSAGRITLKANSVTERDIIDRLALASQAGVQVRMNIRGICCMLPGIEGKTENVHVRSVVGQFLEHSRIFVFGEGDDMLMYVGSADLMTRNLCHRVEVAAPITTKPARDAIMVFLDKIFADNVKARALEPTGEYKMVAESRDRDMVSSDEEFSVQSWCIEHPLQGLKRSTGSVFAQPSDTFAKDVELDLDFEIKPHVDEAKVERMVDELFADELEASGLVSRQEPAVEEVEETPEPVAEETIEEAAVETVVEDADDVEDNADDVDDAEEIVEETEVDVKEEVVADAVVVAVETADDAPEEPAVVEESFEFAAEVPGDAGDDIVEEVVDGVVETVDEAPVVAEAEAEADEETAETETIESEVEVEDDNEGSEVELPAADEDEEDDVADDEINEFFALLASMSKGEGEVEAEVEPEAEAELATDIEPEVELEPEVEPEPESEPTPIDFNVDFDEDLSGLSNMAAEVDALDVTAPMEKIIDAQIEVDEVSSHADDAESASRDLDLSFLMDSESKKSEADEPAVDGSNEASVEDVVFVQVGNMPIESSDEVPVDETPTEERLQKERDFMSDFPHGAVKKKDGEPQDDSLAPKTEPASEAEAEPEKKGFFRNLFS